MLASSDRSFSACRLVAEREYERCIQMTTPPPTSFVSEHWFYLFVFRHCERLARLFPGWIDEMQTVLVHPSYSSSMHQTQMHSLIILFKQVDRVNLEQ